MLSPFEGCTTIYENPDLPKWKATQNANDMRVKSENTIEFLKTYLSIKYLYTKLLKYGNVLLRHCRFFSHILLVVYNSGYNLFDKQEGIFSIFQIIVAFENFF